jgi:hypothetical protein
MADEHDESCDHDHESGWESVPLSFDPLQGSLGETQITFTDGELLQLFTTAQQYYLFCESRFEEGDRSMLLAFESRFIATAIGKLAGAMAGGDNKFFEPHKEQFAQLSEQFTEKFGGLLAADELARRFRDTFGEGAEE